MSPGEAPKGATRREVIQRGLIGGILLLLGGASALALRRGPEAEPPEMPLLALSLAEYSVMLAVVGRMVPDPISTEAERVNTTLRLDATLALADMRTQRDLSRLLGLLESGLAGLILDGQSQPFTARSPAEQEETLEAWRQSSIALRRSGYQALRRLITTHYYASPSAQTAIGYPGPPRGLPPASPLLPDLPGPASAPAPASTAAPASAPAPETSP